MTNAGCVWELELRPRKPALVPHTVAQLIDISSVSIILVTKSKTSRAPHWAMNASQIQKKNLIKIVRIFLCFHLQNTLLFHEERNNSKCLFEKPNNNNNNSPRFSGASKTEWFLHPRVQDLVDHQMALMEVTDSTW